MGSTTFEKWIFINKNKLTSFNNIELLSDKIKLFG